MWSTGRGIRLPIFQSHRLWQIVPGWLLSCSAAQSAFTETNPAFENLNPIFGNRQRRWKTHNIKTDPTKKLTLTCKLFCFKYLKRPVLEYLLFQPEGSCCWLDLWDMRKFQSCLWGGCLSGFQCKWWWQTCEGRAGGAELARNFPFVLHLTLF